MPLHLLGKKSWNVYNKDNIARVRRDEALAKAREDENEQREQEADAEKRIQILRGLREASPPAQQEKLEDKSTAGRERRDHGDSRHRKRRRLPDENDTDRDIRLAKEDVEKADTHRKDVTLQKPSGDQPVVDDSGHISLFPAESSRNHDAEKHPEAEAEEARKKREYEDQYTMRFSNAAGFKQNMEKPWYSSSARDLAQADIAPSKDVWGNEDPRRCEREKLRVSANDPLASMKKGVSQLREVEKERKKWDEERRRELQALKREQKESRRHRRRRSAGSPDSLENFRLDDDLEEKEDRRRRRRSRRHHREDRERRSKHSRPHSSRRTRRTEDRSNKRRRSLTPTTTDSGWTHAPGKRYSAQFAGS